MKGKFSSNRRGFLAGGNWIIDQVKIIDSYPALEQLANIRSQHQGTGGSPYNILLNLAKLGVEFPLFGAGLVGKDALGQSILEDCAKHKIDTTRCAISRIRRTATLRTCQSAAAPEASQPRT